MQNPMVQSDLVTYMGGTIVILFLQATNDDKELRFILKILIYWSYNMAIHPNIGDNLYNS